MTYVPPSLPVLFDIDSSRPIPHAPTVPLRVPLLRRRWSGLALAVVFVAVAAVAFAAVAFAASYQIAMWLVGTGQVGR